MLKDIYTPLLDYLDFVRTQFGLNICIKDFSGFIYSNAELTRVFQPFMTHSNLYCLSIKARDPLAIYCLRSKKLVGEKCHRIKGPFFGMCHAGVEEFTLPVIHYTTLVATIGVGNFRSNETTGIYLLRKICKKYNLPEKELLGAYFEALSPSPPSTETVTSLFGITFQTILKLYNYFMSSSSYLDKRFDDNSNENYVLDQILHFIQENFRQTITVSDLAQLTHHSESYISHLFKRKMKVNIKRYINQLRIEEAKTQLRNSDISIGELGLALGFSDPNYFTRVFKDICGLSPSDFKSVTQEDN